MEPSSFGSEGSSFEGWPCPRTIRCSSSSGHRRTTEGCRRRAPEPGTPTRHDPLEHCTVFQDQFGRFTWLRRKDAVRGCSLLALPLDPLFWLPPLPSPPSLLASCYSRNPLLTSPAEIAPLSIALPPCVAGESLLSFHWRVGCGQGTRLNAGISLTWPEDFGVRGGRSKHTWVHSFRCFTLFGVRD